MNLYQTSKQTPASLPEICAPRNTLLQTYERAAKSPYIYVQAPAGYGKTISTLLWLKKYSAKHIWITLDAYDNTPYIFYKLLCLSFLNIIPHDPEDLQLIKSSDFNATPVECTMDILSQLTYEDCKYVLVLDDFHVIHNESIKKSLPFVLKRLPTLFNVVILSRNALPHSDFDLYNMNNMSTIGMNELTFSSEEIRKHLANYGHFITGEEAHSIQTYTEGWVIAINTIAMSGNINVSDEPGKPTINSFIEKNIWNRFDDSMHTFLMQTSVPDRFSLPLCLHITENEHCKELLTSLLSDNVNIALVGDEYRYHNLFLDFLRDKLNQSTLDKALLNKGVADYCLKSGDFMTAKNYAMKSGDMAAISQTIRSFYSLKTFSLDEYVELNRLYHLNDIPDMICDRMPLLYIARIFFAYVTGDVKLLNRLHDKLFEILNQIAIRFPESLENATSILLMDCRIKLADLDRYMAQIPPSTNIHTQLQSPTFTFQMPFLHRCARDFSDFIVPKAIENFKCFSKNIIKDNLDIMTRGAEAGLMLEQNNLTEALELAMDLKNSIHDGLSPEFVYAIYVLIAEIYCLQHKTTLQEEVLKNVKSYIKDCSAQYLLKNLSAYETRIALMNGDKSAAEQWLRQYFVNDHSYDEFYKIYRNFTTARAYIVLRQPEKAQFALNKLRMLAQNYRRLLDFAEADILISITEWMTGNKKEAQNRLHDVLTLLLPYGFIRVVANEGQSILPILSAILKKAEKAVQPSDDFLKFVKQVYFAAYEQSKYMKGLTDHEQVVSLRLSPQQKRILELLAKGHKNAEIVEITELSLNTIRTHTKLAYQKLEVNNVMDAIVKARQMGLID